MSRRSLALLVLAVIAAGLAWAFWPRPVQVETATIARTTLDVQVQAEGQARIRDVYTVSAPIAGYLERVELHPGDPVDQDSTVLARIRPMPPSLLDLRARRVAEAVRDAAAAAVDLAQAQVTQAEAELKFRTEEMTRAETLRAHEAISARAYDEARLAQTAAQAALDSARATLLVRQREEQSAAAALIVGGGSEPAADACCTDLLAPVSGQVLRVRTESEQVVAAGTPILDIGNPLQLEVEADFLSADAVRIAAGADAVIDGWGGPALPAHVTLVEPSASTRVSALGIEEQRVTVRLALDGDPAGYAALGDGYRVIARVTVWRGTDVVAVPVAALFRLGEDWAVLRISDGRAQSVRLDLGERTDRMAEVLSGLAPGEQVILHPSDQIADGTAVTPLAAGD